MKRTPILMVRVSSSFIYLITVMCSNMLNAAEWSADANISTSTVYDDNVFVTSKDETTSSLFTVSPEIEFSIKDINWANSLYTKYTSNNYSNDNLDDDKLSLRLINTYGYEKETYALTTGYDISSNLEADSSDFSLVDQEVKRESFFAMPVYSRRHTERLGYSLSYNYSNTDYDDTLNALFVPFEIQTITAKSDYSLTERSGINGLLSLSDYESKDGSLAYETLTFNVGVSYRISEITLADVALGKSNTKITSIAEVPINLFGLPAVQIVESERTTEGLVYNSGFNMKLLKSELSGRVSRSNVSSSFGGLDEVDNVSMQYSYNITELLKNVTSATYDKIRSISGTTATASDRDIWRFNTDINYRLDRYWTFSTSYSYVQRGFESGANDGASSNRLYIRLIYKFPTYSSF